VHDRELRKLRWVCDWAVVGQIAKELGLPYDAQHDRFPDEVRRHVVKGTPRKRTPWWKRWP
jgi:hypothetical protein